MLCLKSLNSQTHWALTFQIRIQIIKLYFYYKASISTVSCALNFYCLSNCRYSFSCVTQYCSTYDNILQPSLIKICSSSSSSDTCEEQTDASEMIPTAGMTSKHGGQSAECATPAETVKDSNRHHNRSQDTRLGGTNSCLVSHSEELDDALCPTCSYCYLL